MSEDLDLSFLDEINEELEAALSPAWRRIVAALRRLKEGRE